MKCCRQASLVTKNDLTHAGHRPNTLLDLQKAISSRHKHACLPGQALSKFPKKGIYGIKAGKIGKIRLRCFISMTYIVSRCYQSFPAEQREMKQVIMRQLNYFQLVEKHQGPIYKERIDTSISEEVSSQLLCHLYKRFSQCNHSAQYTKDNQRETKQ